MELNGLDIARIFAKLVMEGKPTEAIKFRIRRIPPAEPIQDESLLHGPIEPVKAWFFETIGEQAIFKAAAITKGSIGPSGMDTELYLIIIFSTNFNVEEKTLREEIALFTRN